MALQSFLRKVVREGSLTVRSPDGSSFQLGDGCGPPVAVSISVMMRSRTRSWNQPLRNNRTAATEQAARRINPATITRAQIRPALLIEMLPRVLKPSFHIHRDNLLILMLIANKITEVLCHFGLRRHEMRLEHEADGDATMVTTAVSRVG